MSRPFKHRVFLCCVSQRVLCVGGGPGRACGCVSWEKQPTVAGSGVAPPVPEETSLQVGARVLVCLRSLTKLSAGDGAASGALPARDLL